MRSSSAPVNQTVLSSVERRGELPPSAVSEQHRGEQHQGEQHRGDQHRGERPPRRAWALAGALAATTASLGGVYYYRRLRPDPGPAPALPAPAPDPALSEVYPSEGGALPRHVQFLLVGGGTASFAAMRAIRAARPDAAVLVVGEEPLPPYMRPPLSKEVWREPRPAAEPGAPSFRQWNGRRRPLLYEPLAFYTPVERLAGGGGAAAARGWRVERLRVERHEAELRAPGREPVTVSYERCLLAPGVRARRLPALRAARDAGRALAVRDVRDAARLAALVDAPATRHVLVVGGGLLGSELAAALAARLAPAGKRVTMLCRGEAPLRALLPPYLAAEAAARLRGAGVRLVTGAEVAGAEAAADGVAVALRGGGSLRADAVVECVGAELDESLARASGLELAEGRLAASAELQARADVWAAGDAVSWHDPALGRRALEHHDHAVASGRRAGDNMAAPDRQLPYTHRPMFWSDLGPELGYEAIGVIDSRLHTVGVFTAAGDVAAGDVAAGDVAAGDVAAGDVAAGDVAASDVAAGDVAAGDVAASDVAAGDVAAGDVAAGAGGGARRYERGVVFYMRERRVVGVLLWNVFNRMHVARQVLAGGEFDDLLEVAKLFALHDDD